MLKGGTSSHLTLHSPVTSILATCPPTNITAYLPGSKSPITMLAQKPKKQLTLPEELEKIEQQVLVHPFDLFLRSSLLQVPVSALDGGTNTYRIDHPHAARDRSQLQQSPPNRHILSHSRCRAVRAGIEDCLGGIEGTLPPSLPPPKRKESSIDHS